MSSTKWAVVKDLCSGALKKVPVSSLMVVLNGKRLQAYNPKDNNDLTSRKASARVKRETNGIKYVRRVRILHLNDTSDGCNLERIKNPTFKKVEASLYSEYELVNEIDSMKNDKRVKKLTSLSDMDQISKRMKLDSVSRASTSSQQSASPTIDELRSSPKPSSELRVSTTNEKIKPQQKEDHEQNCDHVPNPTDSGSHIVYGPSAIDHKQKAGFQSVSDNPRNTDGTVNSFSGLSNRSSSITKHQQKKNDEQSCDNDLEPAPKSTDTGSHIVSGPSAIDHQEKGLQSIAVPSSSDGVLNSQPIDSFKANLSDDDVFPIEPVVQNNHQECNHEGSCCILIRQELLLLRNEVAEFKAILERGSEMGQPLTTPTTSRIWPIRNAVSPDMPAPPSTPLNMVYCGSEAKCLALDVIDKCILSDMGLRSKIVHLTNLMFTTNLLKEYWLQAKKGVQRKIFPEDTKLALQIISLTLDSRGWKTPML